MTRIEGLAAIEYAETHGVTLSKYADPTEDARSGLTVAEAREVARDDAGLIYVDSTDVDCDCGTVTGTKCSWRGPISEVVLVEWMPEYLRPSHVAARNRGTYPYNGAWRFWVERSCAKTLAETEGEWLRIVED